MHKSSPFLQTLQGKETSLNPIWLMRQAGRYLPIYQKFAELIPDFWERCFQPDISSEISTFPIQEYDLDAVIFFSDILIIPKILGQDISFIKGHGIQIKPHDLDKLLENYNPNSFHKDLFPVYQGLTMTRIKTPKHLPVIGFAGAPWTILNYMVGANQPDRHAYTTAFAEQNPAKVSAWINALADIVAQHVMNQISVGAEAFQLFESHAANVPPAYRDEWLIKPWHRIRELVRKAFPNAPAILFPRGCDTDILASLEGYEGVSLPESIPIAKAVSSLPSSLVLQGGPTPNELVQGGAVLENALDAINAQVSGRPFIWNLTHGVLPETPVAHVHQYIKKVRSF